MMASDFSKAYALAELVYRLVDKEDVFLHSTRVMAKCKDLEHKTVAILHDIVEDTIVDEYDLSEFVDQDIVDQVLILTRRLSETYDQYIQRIIKSGIDAVTVKLADIEDHLEQKETLKESLKKRYVKAKHDLSSYVRSQEKIHEDRERAEQDRNAQAQTEKHVGNIYVPNT